LETAARTFVRYSPHILLLFLVVIVAFCAYATLVNEFHFLLILQFTIGLLTTVESPWSHSELLCAPGLMFLAWLTTLAGWLIIPTTVALVLGFGQKTLDEDEYLRFQLFMFATTVLKQTGKDREDWVNDQMKRGEEWARPTTI